ncbi:MAG TPA: hypothetical protein VFN78_01650 [Ktedonobacterales bacterium]|nr:hypothetical protein [Ktedonobacterales bacterium]
MRTLRIVELVTGWLAVATSVAIALNVWLGGFIAPQSVVVDLVTFALLLTVIAWSVTVESMTGSLTARIILTLAALALAGVFVISFLIELGVPALLALCATLIAWTRHLSAPGARRAA